MRRRFAPWFNEVTLRVRARWHPADVMRGLDPDGTRFRRVDRYTLLGVVLSGDGALTALAVEVPSGVEELDNTARAAFEAAAPFPPPPGQLVGSDGRVRFRFGFFLDNTGSRTKARPVRP
jgi:TonB family protein